MDQLIIRLTKDNKNYRLESFDGLKRITVVINEVGLGYSEMLAVTFLDYFVDYDIEQFNVHTMIFEGV